MRKIKKFVRSLYLEIFFKIKALEQTLSVAIFKYLSTKMHNIFLSDMLGIYKLNSQAVNKNLQMQYFVHQSESSSQTMLQFHFLERLL